MAESLLLWLGQAKLIIRFPFQGLQNSMREGGHFSLFIMIKILRKQFKKPHQCNNEKFVIIEIRAVKNCHIMKILWYFQKSCGRKQESNDQLCLAL